MRIKFHKMHSLGNDFMVMSRGDEGYTPTAGAARIWGNRRLGIGFDQLLFVETDGVVPVCRVWNADGSPAGQCGNGARCVAAYLHDRHHVASPMTFKMGDTEVRAEIHADGDVTALLVPPMFGAEATGFRGACDNNGECDLVTSAGRLRFGLVSMGNPHAVTVTEADDFPVAEVGAEVQAMSEFTQGVNVGFMTIKRRDCIRLRVVERGCGETPACGSGACAAVAVGRRRGLLDERVTVCLPGGELIVEWKGEGRPMQMTGAVMTVYCGEVRIPGVVQGAGDE